MKILKAEVIKASFTTETRYGLRAVLNCKLDDTHEKVACWSENLEEPKFINLKIGDKINLIKTPKGAYQVLEVNSNSTITPASTNAEVLASTNTLAPPTATTDILTNLKLLTERDKKQLSLLIKQNSKILKYCCSCVAEEFPDLDKKSVNSLGITIFINSQIFITKNL